MNTQESVSSSPVLATPDVVVQDYLDFMLRAVTETVEINDDPLSCRSQPAGEEPLSFPEPLASGLAPTQEAFASGLAPAGEIIAPVAATPRAANGKPEWAQAPFECLLFQVAGLKLAAALVELGGIARITEELTPIFGQSEWFMGLLRWNERNIRVVDTARLIMPERISALRAGERSPYEFVLMIEGTDWGLAIDSATEAMHLNPAEVRWRTNMQTRPWLAGTVLDKLCALLDMNAIACRLHIDQKDSGEGNTA